MRRLACVLLATVSLRDLVDFLVSMNNTQSFLQSYLPPLFPVAPTSHKFPSHGVWVGAMDSIHMGTQVPQCLAIMLHQVHRKASEAHMGSFISESLMRNRSMSVLCPCCFPQLSKSTDYHLSISAPVIFI